MCHQHKTEIELPYASLAESAPNIGLQPTPCSVPSFFAPAFGRG